MKLFFKTFTSLSHAPFLTPLQSLPDWVALVDCANSHSTETVPILLHLVCFVHSYPISHGIRFGPVNIIAELNELLTFLLNRDLEEIFDT